MRLEVGRTKLIGTARYLQEWDGTAEPPVDTLRYTLERKAVLKTKRLGMNTGEDVFLSPKAFWDATLHHSLDASLQRGFSQECFPVRCLTNGDATGART